MFSSFEMATLLYGRSFLNTLLYNLNNEDHLKTQRLFE